MIRYTAKDSDAGKRLDLSVVEHAGKVSRAFIERLRDNGQITVNKQVEKNGYKLRLGDKVVVNYDFNALERVPDIDLPILYEDDDCVVINKPIGVLTHSKGVFNPEATVATFIRGRVKSLSGDRAGIAHRLDRTTSGVIICAKTPEALSWLQKQFSQRRVKKKYIAIVEGRVEPEEAVIDMPIERNPKKPQTFRVSEVGRPASTEYKVLKSGSYSLLELRPLTGRTHQLRVHLKAIGHPILGDALYEGKQAERIYLHAKSLEITLPSRERKVFTAPLPDGFKKPLEKAQWSR